MRVFAIWAAAMAVGCASTGPAEYGPAADGRFGYEETQIEDNRFRIVYRGSGGMPPEIVEDYALRRAAELALFEGYEWFRVVAREVMHEERGGVSIGAGVATGSYGRRGGVSVGVGGDVGRVGARDFFTARIEVLMGSADAPDEAEVYDAADVVESFAGGAAATE